MGTIALVVDDLGKTNKARAIAALRRSTSLSISEIQTRSQTSQPLLQVATYGPEFPDRAAELRALVQELESYGSAVYMFRLMNNQSLTDVNRKSLIQVDLQMLENIVKAHEDEERHHKTITSFREIESDEHS